MPHPTGAVDDQTLAFAGAFGRAALPQSGLVQLGARTYDAQTGSFTTRDLVVGPAGEPARRVPYAYAFNGPARFSDLDGRSPVDWVTAHADQNASDMAAIANDPNASAAEKALATVGGWLNVLANCENLTSTSLALATGLTFGGASVVAGAGVVPRIGLAERFAATAAGVALKNAVEHQAVRLAVKFGAKVENYAKFKREVDIIAKQLWDLYMRRMGLK